MSDGEKDVVCFTELLERLIVDGNWPHVVRLFPSQRRGARWRMGGGGRNAS